MKRARHGMWFVTALALSGCGLLGSRSEPQLPTNPPVAVDGGVLVDLDRPIVEVSPLIRGVAGDVRDFDDANVAFNSWGGPRSTRFNYQLGNAWNTGRDGAFRNESAPSSDDLVGEWLTTNEAAGVASRVAVPALGWIARDGDPSTCSFPDESRTGCLTASGFDCASTGPIADPMRANVGSSPATVSEWISGYEVQRLAPTFLAVDNEPERWGIDHYDVHPTCTDYFEILGTYVAYASALRQAAPSAQLAGPVMCCWYDFADSPGPGDGTDEDLLNWFLRTLSERDDPAAGDDVDPLLDVVDLHFRPSADVVNGRSGPDVDLARLESTRELWDPEHRAENSGEIIEFLPRVRRTTDAYFPGMPIMISDWRFGGEDSIGGALAIFETLGIFAREGVHAAAHADTLVPDTPGFHAFRLFGNYDGRGAAFEGIVVDAALDDLTDVSVFAAVERNTLRIGLVNRSGESQRIRLDVDGAERGGGSMFTYSGANLDEFVESVVTALPDGSGSSMVELPPMSASMVEFNLRGSVDVRVPSTDAESTDDGGPDDVVEPDDGAGT